MKQFWRHQIYKLYQNITSNITILVFLIGFGIDCSFLVVLPSPLKTCRSNVFFTKRKVHVWKIRRVSEVLCTWARPIGIRGGIWPGLYHQKDEYKPILFAKDFADHVSSAYDLSNFKRGMEIFNSWWISLSEVKNLWWLLFMKNSFCEIEKLFSELVSYRTSIIQRLETKTSSSKLVVIERSTCYFLIMLIEKVC